MANKAIFGSAKDVSLTTNLAGGQGYKMGDEHALVQIAMTGTLQNVFYASGEDQADQVIELARRLPASFVAQTAVYARNKGYMKDTPALLMAVLASRPDGQAAFKAAFPRVCDNAKMVRNFVQILRSGKVGRKNLGSMPRRAVQNWLGQITDRGLLNASVGQSPSLADIIKLAHPKANTPERNALYGYLTGRPHDSYALPKIVQEFEDFKLAPEGQPVPDLDFRLLSSLKLTPSQWAEKALQLPVEALRMNLNTLARNGAFGQPGVTEAVVQKLTDREAVRKAHTMPVSVLNAYLSVDDAVPAAVKDALHTMMEITTDNVPKFEGSRVAILVDVSGSMGSLMTNGKHVGKARYIDIASAVACAIWRQNPGAELVPIDTAVHKHSMTARDSILTNTKILARFGGGRTSLDVALKHVQRPGVELPDVVLVLSDNESWADLTDVRPGYRRGSAMAEQWKALLSRNPKAKLICVDLAPYRDLTNQDSPSVLNIGGWTDEAFSVMESFVNGSNAHWVDSVKGVVL